MPGGPRRTARTTSRLSLAALALVAACGDGNDAGDASPVCRSGPATAATAPAGPDDVTSRPLPAVSPPPGFDVAVRTAASNQYLAAGFGSVWVPQPDEGTVTRVDAASGAVLAVVDVTAPAEPGATAPHVQAVAVGDDGVWVTATRARALLCIDPGTDRVATRIPLDLQPYAVAADSGTLWVTDFEGSRLASVDTTRGRVRLVVEDVRFPTGVAVGGGSVWVALHRAGVVVRLDPASGRETGRVELGGTLEQAQFAGGALWVAGNTSRALHRVDPDGLRVTSVPLAGSAYGVAVDDRAAWVSEGPQEGCEASNSNLVRVDLRSAAVERLPLACAFGVVVADDRVWATTDEEPAVLVRAHARG